ncbi:hypothetical protein F1C76_12375 [Geodermatophilaceae bacterium NBWT11]|nr:hypothetical protein F1C76_12375 [Geodermatophilaceae bacterium NBWT11]
MRRTSLVVAVLVAVAVLAPTPALACFGATCPPPSADVSIGEGSVTTAVVSGAPGDAVRSASFATPTLRTYELVRPCDFTDGPQGACEVGLEPCVQIEGRVVTQFYVISRRVVQGDAAAIDGLAPAPGAVPGANYGPPTNEGLSCVDVTDLNPPPSPDEVFRYFQTLPLPELVTQQQPPGNGLVGLPVIFFTDSPTQQTFTVDIRGFQVVIVAGAQSYTWHTGDGTTLTSTDPGAPYPGQTVTHDYSSGSYTAYVTVTWGATFSVDGGAQVAVPGTTTTDGPAVTFAVLEAGAVLTNPYD